MRVTFIGAGAMGRAIAQGAHAKDPKRWKFTFFDTYADHAKRLALSVDGRAAASLADATGDADIIVLAVKPQVQASVIEVLPPTENALVISIAAGRTLTEIESDFNAAGNPDVPLVRVMPNINALIGSAISAICHNLAAKDDQVAAAKALFDSVGETIDIPEPLFSAFTAMAGSSPAWFFQIVDDLARAGVKHGLTKDQAVTAACASMLGSARMLQAALAEGGCAADLVDRVCSPGGTTIAGLLAAEEKGLGPALVAAVDATVARDRELGAS